MPPKVPLGKALELTDDDLDALTTPEEMQKVQKEADKFIKENAPLAGQLVDAVEE